MKIRYKNKTYSRKVIYPRLYYNHTHIVKKKGLATIARIMDFAEKMLPNAKMIALSNKNKNSLKKY